MKKEQKRQEQLRQRTLNESLQFQTMFGARQKFAAIPAEIEVRLNQEMALFADLGVAEDILTLKDIMEKVKSELGYSAEPSKGVLANSMVAYCLGIEPNNPSEAVGSLSPLELRLPIHLDVYYDNDIRNQVAAWIKEHGYEFSTYLGQPLLKLKKSRIVFRRVVKS